MRFFAIVQVRLSSKRLPRKALARLNPNHERPVVLEHLIQRVLKVDSVDAVILAVPENELADFQRIPFLKDALIVGGSSHDVLGRFLKAAQDAGCSDWDHIIRLTADNPFLDHRVLEENIAFVRKKKPDYSYPAWLPLGMGFEICRLKVLRMLNELPLAPAHREHVTSYIKENPQKYSIRPMELDYPFHKKIRLTIDERADLTAAQAVYRYFSDEYFCAADVIRLYEKAPRLFSGNEHVQQRSYYTCEIGGK